MTKRLLLACVLILGAPSLAHAEACVSASSGTWSGAGGAGGTISWSGCTPTADDSYTIGSGHTATIDADLGPIAGAITVASGGVLDVDPLVTVDAPGGIEFESGSCASDSCDIGGVALAESAVPSAITYPTANTVKLDFSESIGASAGTLPWDICDSSCTTADVQSGTFIRFHWQSFAETDEGILPPVDEMGMILEVTATDSANNTFTLSFPTVSADAQGNNYLRGIETLSGNRQSNTISAATVVTAALATNNEGKSRYETIVSGDPFDDAGDFSGFLACKTGTDRCARIIYTEPDYSGANELITTLRDPSDLWGTGDTLDFYYAKLTAGDRFTPFNGPTFTATGSPSEPTMTIEEGSELRTVEYAAFVDGWAESTSGSALKAVLNIENTITTDTNTAQSLYFVGCDAPDRVAGVDVQGGHVCIKVANTDTTGGGPDGDAIHNVHLSDLFIAYPSGVVDYATNPTVESFISYGVAFQDEQEQRISYQPGWIAGTVAEWTNVTLRRIRIEGSTTGITDASAGRITQCDDDLFMQDILVLHSRSSKPRDGDHIGEDQIEFFPHTQTCGADRVTAFGPNNGTAMGPIRWARPNNGVGWGGTVYLTNAVSLGGPGQQGNTNDAAGRGIVNRSFPCQTPSEYGGGGQGHGHCFPGDDGNGYWMTNFISDNMPDKFSQTYGALVGWWRQRMHSYTALQCGQRMVGTYRLGGGVSGTPWHNYLMPCESPQSDIKFIDNYWVNVGGPTNNGSNASCSSTGSGSGSYQCDGGSEGITTLALTSVNDRTPVPDLFLDSNLIMRFTSSVGFTSGIDFNTAGPSYDVLTISNSTFLGNHTSLLRVLRDYGATPLVEIQNPTIGPNVWSETAHGSAGSCWLNGATTKDTTDCDYSADAAVLRDLSPDDSPNGGNTLYVTGSMTTGIGLRILGSSGGTGDAATAQPRYSGPVVWDVFSWVTPEKKTARFRRTQPREEYMAPIVRNRLYRADFFEIPWDVGKLGSGEKAWGRNVHQ